MAVERVMKRHDTAEPITGTVRAGTPAVAVDLSVYQTVEMTAKAEINGVETIITGECTLGDDDGEWIFEQTDEDVSDAGVYEVEIECTLANGKKVHFPNAKASNPSLQIDEDLDDN